MPERTVMVAIIVTDERLADYLLAQFKFPCSSVGDSSSRFVIPAKFLEILPDDGWNTELFC